MQVNLTGHQVQVTPALREFTTGKLDRLQRHTAKINSIHVTFDVQKLQQIVEATVMINGTEIYARSIAEDMYSAVDGLIDKLDRQIIKYKEKDSDHR